MKSVFTSVFCNLKYALMSAKFWISSAVYLLMMLFYSDADSLFQRGEGIYYILHYTMQHGATEFAFAVCAIPAAALFSEEWCSGRFVFSYTRSKKSAYSASLILSSFLIASLTAVISMCVYILIFSFTNPFAADPQNGSFMQIVRSYANGGLMAQGHFFAYYFITILTEGCYIGIFSAASTMISIKITNSYIAVVMPLVLGIVIPGFAEFARIPKIVVPNNVFSASTFLSKFFNPSLDLNRNFSVISAIYPFIYTIILLAVFIILSYFFLDRKQEKIDIR